MDRVRTGNNVTDSILGGGFPVNTINIVMGQPGTGKTILVQQIVFANAGDDRPILYFTTLSEPLAKLVRFVQEFDFFDEMKVGTAVHYEDIGAVLSKDGISTLIPRLRDAIRTVKPALIVVDSFKALHDLTDSPIQFRQLVYELTGLLTAYETTTFLVGEYHQDDIRFCPEFAVADGVVELSRRPLDTRDERHFRVLKLRGSSYLEGSHTFQITSSGLDIHPRLVTPREPVEYEAPADRTSMGVPGLDRMLDGGVLSGSSTLVAGPSGSGKTTLALQFAVEGVRRGESVVYINFQENPTQLARAVESLADGLGTTGLLDFLYVSPVELQIDSVIVELFRRIETQAVRRVVLDAVGDLAASTSEPHRLHDYMYALIQHLAVHRISSVFVFENYGPNGAGGVLNTGPISYMADNLILLEMRGAERIRRTIRVVKARGSAHDTDVRDISIDAEGIQVIDPA